MNIKDDKYKEAGTINSFKTGVEDHGLLTCYVFVDYDNGCTQGFGGLMLGRGEKDDKLFKSYVKDLCDTFGVSSLEELKGKRCYALKSFDGWNETIAGLETESGARFTHYVFRKKHFPKTKSPLEERTEHLESEIVHLNKRLAETKFQLKQIKSKYKDWG